MKTYEKYATDQRLLVKLKFYFATLLKNTFIIKKKNSAFEKNHELKQNLKIEK